MHKKVLNGYDKFNTYVVVRSLRATTNFGNLDIQHLVMTLEARTVVSGLSHNNNNTTVLSILFVPCVYKSYKQLLSRIE